MGALNRVMRHLRYFEESTFERLEQEVAGERARRDAVAQLVSISPAQVQELRDLAQRVVVSQLGEADAERRARLLSRKLHRLANRFLDGQRAKEEAQ